MEYARDGDVIVVHTLDRLGHTVRDGAHPSLYRSVLGAAWGRQDTFRPALLRCR
ncbi:hypothetical protein [Brevibacterium sp. UCMA 11754]|uniref:hypothetical protein n=1 Tax=Brevibacterium sp. UCMA 11754 TaxID=2749198 RepID=UPI001F3E410B|nr:hypothetical protein [Brevibacterium sp. UCMA 11754]